MKEKQRRDKPTESVNQAVLLQCRIAERFLGGFPEELRCAVLSSAISKVLIIGETSVTGAIFPDTDQLLFPFSESCLLNIKNSFFFLLPPSLFYSPISSLSATCASHFQFFFLTCEYKISFFSFFSSSPPFLLTQSKCYTEEA